MQAFRWRSSVIVGLALAGFALICGYLGYRSVPGLALSRSDAFFSAIQLFVLEASATESPTPWTLNVARFTAPIALAFATVVAIAAIVREQLQAVLVTWFARDHVVMIGTGRSGDLTAKALRTAGHQVVIIESDGGQNRFESLRAVGVKVLLGDPTVHQMLSRAAIRRALHVIVTTSDDSRNLEIVERLSEVLRAREDGQRTIVHVAIGDRELWHALGRLHTAQVRSGTLFEFYNVDDRAAQALLNEVHHRGGDTTHIRLHGDGPLLHRTLSHLVRSAALAGVRPRVHLTTNGDDLRQVLEEEPWILEEADMVRACSPDFHDVAPTALICSSGDDAAALASALTLAAHGERRKVFLAAATQQAGGFLDSIGVADKVHVIPAGSLAMGKEFLHQSGPELMARARHEDYLAQERAKGATAETNPSLVPWELLPESLRESNRRFAESVGQVISQAGYQLVPLRSLTFEASLFSGQLLERLAVDEHDRWVASLERDGWTYAAGAKDPHHKTHPLLVPWSELAEEEREKDRDAIRAIPRMLARAGFGLSPIQTATQS